MDGQPDLEVARGRPGHRVVHPPHRGEHHPGEEQVEQQEHQHERESDAPVDEPAGHRLAAVEGREALHQVEPPVRLPRRRERRHEGQDPLAAEARLAELVLPRRRPAARRQRLLALDAAAGEERPAARAHQVGLAVPVHQQHDLGPREEGRRVRTEEAEDDRRIGGRAEVEVDGLDPGPQDPLLRREVREVQGQRLAVSLELVVDELALVVAAQRREQPLVLLEQPLALGGEDRGEHEEERGEAEQEHDREGERHLAAQAQVAQRPQDGLHGSPSQPRTSARGDPSGVFSTE